MFRLVSPDRRSRRLVALASALVGLCALPAVAAADSRTIHVSPLGTDGAAVAGDALAPYATVGYALSRAEGGETIKVAAGTYPEYNDVRERTETVVVEPLDPDNPPLLEAADHWGGQA